MRGVRLWGSLAFPKPMTWLERMAVRILAYRWHIEMDVELEETIEDAQSANWRAVGVRHVLNPVWEDCERCEGGTVPMDCPDCYGIGKVRL